MVLKKEYSKEELVSIINKKADDLYTYAKAKFAIGDYEESYKRVFFCAETPTAIVEGAVASVNENFMNCMGLFITYNKEDNTVYFLANYGVYA